MSCKPGAASTTSEREGISSSRRSSSGTSAASTSGDARLMSSISTHCPWATACVSGPGCHTNSPGRAVQT